MWQPFIPTIREVKPVNLNCQNKQNITEDRLYNNRYLEIYHWNHNVQINLKFIRIKNICFQLCIFFKSSLTDLVPGSAISDPRHARPADALRCTGVFNSSPPQTSKSIPHHPVAEHENSRDNHSFTIDWSLISRSAAFNIESVKLRVRNNANGMEKKNCWPRESSPECVARGPRTDANRGGRKKSGHERLTCDWCCCRARWSETPKSVKFGELFFRFKRVNWAWNQFRVLETLDWMTGFLCDAPSAMSKLSCIYVLWNTGFGWGYGR